GLRWTWTATHPWRAGASPGATPRRTTPDRDASRRGHHLARGRHHRARRAVARPGAAHRGRRGRRGPFPVLGGGDPRPVLRRTPAAGDPAGRLVAGRARAVSGPLAGRTDSPGGQGPLGRRPPIRLRARNGAAPAR